MKQGIKISDNGSSNLSSEEINKFVADNFFRKLNELVKEFPEIKSDSDLAKVLQVGKTHFSNLKNGRHNKTLPLYALYNAVNNLNADSNAFFVNDSQKNSNDNIEVNSSGSGNNNNVVKSEGTKIVQGSVINGNNHGDIYTAEKIINQLPAKYRAEINDALTKIQTQNDQQASEIVLLKKTIARYEKDIRALTLKAEKYDSIMDKYTALLEKMHNDKK